MNRGGQAIAVVRPRLGLRWNGSPVIQEAFNCGILDVTTSDVGRNSWLVALISRIAAKIGLRLEAMADKSRVFYQKKAAEIVVRGSWLVETCVGGWTYSTVHATHAEARKATGRPSESGKIWQGDFAQHCGGWVSAKGRKFLREQWDD